jgi:hypothetical protein
VTRRIEDYEQAIIDAALNYEKRPGPARSQPLVRAVREYRQYRDSEEHIAEIIAEMQRWLREGVLAPRP